MGVLDGAFDGLTEGFIDTDGVVLGAVETVGASVGNSLAVKVT